ncbi:MAG: hypothetical protein DWQ07_02660 [Chloroflexi bacterium]|nr:MAG: hypothetical protein DWQ07_02660 [Chloroflexota bacterium]MBL1193599.1 hypothetical protein [Chloroflexota bacterium]NOH10891.1 hypothetical protein [Chloroflexota bacterium]
MDHPLFEDRMHDDDNLPEELQAAWEQVVADIQLAGMAAPAPGFSDRFRVRVAEQRAREERRQAWWFLGINLFLASLVLLVLGLRIVPTLPAPSALLVSWVGTFTQIITWFEVLISVGGSLLKTLPGLVPPSWWASILAASIGLAILWIATLRQYTLPQGAQA